MLTYNQIVNNPMPQHPPGSPARARVTYIVLLLEELQVGDLVTAQVVDNLLALQQVGDLARLLLELLQAAQDVLALLVELGRGFVQALQVGLELADEVNHVGRLEQLVLGLGDLERLGVIVLGDLALGEVQQREDQVAVEVAHERGQKIVLGHDGWWRRSRDVGACDGFQSGAG